MSDEQEIRASAYSIWGLAFVKSAAVTVFSVVLVGAWFLPREIARLQTKPEMFAVHCQPTSDGRSLVALMTFSGKVPAASVRHDHLRLQPLSGDTLSWRNLLPDLVPARIALDKVGNRLFVGDDNGELIPLYLKYPDALYQSFGRMLQGPVESMGCSEDGTTLVVFGGSALVAWDISDHSIAGSPRWCQVDASIECFALSPDSAVVFCARNRDKCSDLVEIEIHTGVTRLLFPDIGEQMKKIVISADGTSIVCVQDNYSIVLFERSSPSQAWQSSPIPNLHSGKTNVAAIAPESTLLITSNAEANQLVAWDLKRKQPQLRFEPQSSLLLGCAFLDNEQILSWNADGILQIWNVRTPEPIREIKF